jgi:hypothetical protein
MPPASPVAEQVAGIAKAVPEALKAYFTRSSGRNRMRPICDRGTRQGAASRQRNRAAL